MRPKWIARFVVLKTYKDIFYWQLNESFLGYETLLFEKWQGFQINRPKIILSHIEFCVAGTDLMTTTALSILSTLIKVCDSAHPLGSNFLPRSPIRGDTNSSIRDKSAETDGLHNFGSPLHETYIKCCKKGNLTHLAKEDSLCFNYCSDKYLVYSSVEMITIFRRYLSRVLSQLTFWTSMWLEQLQTANNQSDRMMRNVNKTIVTVRMNAREVKQMCKIHWLYC